MEMEDKKRRPWTWKRENGREGLARMKIESMA